MVGATWVSAVILGRFERWRVRDLRFFCLPAGRPPESVCFVVPGRRVLRGVGLDPLACVPGRGQDEGDGRVGAGPLGAW
jgi:hypothetical protein